jgi:hypothetical protein
MQAVALVTGDEFLVPYNLTIDIGDVDKYMDKLSWMWYTTMQNIGFDGYRGVRFATILGHSGYCQSFNIVALSDIFRVTKYCSYCLLKQLTPFINFEYWGVSDKFSYPLSVTHFSSGLLSNILKRDNVPGYRFESLDQNHHEKFNYQGLNYYIHSPYEFVSRESSFHQTIANHSIIVHLSPRKIIVDEALQSYPPERFDVS